LQGKAFALFPPVQLVAATWPPFETRELIGFGAHAASGIGFKQIRSLELKNTANRSGLTIRTKALVLACGGFEANREWRARYLGPGWDMAKVRKVLADSGMAKKQGRPRTPTLQTPRPRCTNTVLNL